MFNKYLVIFARARKLMLLFSCYNYTGLEYAVEVDDSTPSVSSQYQSPYDLGVYFQKRRFKVALII